MNKYEYMGNKFLAGSKHLGIIALLFLPIYIILAAMNTGNLVAITYVVLMILVISTFQSIALKIVGIFLIYLSNKK